MGINKLPNKFNVYVYVYDKGVKRSSKGVSERRMETETTAKPISSTYKFNLYVAKASIGRGCLRMVGA